MFGTTYRGVGYFVAGTSYQLFLLRWRYTTPLVDQKGYVISLSLRPSVFRLDWQHCHFVFCKLSAGGIPVSSWALTARIWQAAWDRRQATRLDRCDDLPARRWSWTHTASTATSWRRTSPRYRHRRRDPLPSSAADPGHSSSPRTYSKRPK